MATALLAMGTQPAIAFSKNHPDLGVFLIYEEAGEWQTWVSEKMQDRLVESLK
jgi:thiamine biosynthesis lipoprotein ApbE